MICTPERSRCAAGTTTAKQHYQCNRIEDRCGPLSLGSGRLAWHILVRYGFGLKVSGHPGFR
jgi:hypothetical protein